MGLWVRHTFDQPNWADYVFRTDFEQVGAIENSTLLPIVQEHLNECPWGGNWDDVFSYAGYGDDDRGAHFLVVFYGSYIGVVMIVRRDVATQMAQPELFNRIRI